MTKLVVFIPELELYTPNWARIRRAYDPRYSRRYAALRRRLETR